MLLTGPYLFSLITIFSPIYTCMLLLSLSYVGLLALFLPFLFLIHLAPPSSSRRSATYLNTPIVMCTVASHNGDMYSFTSLAASTHASCSVTTDAIFIPFSFNLIDFSISFNNFICIGPILCLSFLPGISPGCFLFFCSDGSDHCHCHHLFLFWCQLSYFFVIY